MPLNKTEIVTKFIQIKIEAETETKDEKYVLES